MGLEQYISDAQVFNVSKYHQLVIDSVAESPELLHVEPRAVYEKVIVHPGANVDLVMIDYDDAFHFVNTGYLSSGATDAVIERSRKNSEFKLERAYDHCLIHFGEKPARHLVYGIGMDLDIVCEKLPEADLASYLHSNKHEEFDGDLVHASLLQELLGNLKSLGIDDPKEIFKEVDYGPNGLHGRLDLVVLDQEDNLTLVEAKVSRQATNSSSDRLQFMLYHQLAKAKAYFDRKFNIATRAIGVHRDANAETPTFFSLQELADRFSIS